MVVVEVGERQRERAGISTRKARAAKHQSDAVIRYVSRDPTPQQLHGRALPIGSVDAGASELENFAWMGDERRNVVLGCRIEPRQTGCRLPPEQSVSPDNPIMAAAGMVQDQEVIAIVIEAIDVAPPPPHMG